MIKRLQQKITLCLIVMATLGGGSSVAGAREWGLVVNDTRHSVLVYPSQVAPANLWFTFAGMDREGLQLQGREQSTCLGLSGVPEMPAGVMEVEPGKGLRVHIDPGAENHRILPLEIHVEPVRNPGCRTWFTFDVAFHRVASREEGHSFFTCAQGDYRGRTFPVAVDLGNPGILRLVDVEQEPGAAQAPEESEPAARWWHCFVCF